ncbi:MAG: hypothetical protein K8R88_15190 [Armatimonadetes bacterium]|nr:hypothetical protein [Armatimonadota bacterium]
MKKTSLIAFLALLMIGCGGGGVGPEQSFDPEVEANYLSLLAQFPIDRQGYHLDGFGDFSDEPMTYGLILLAEGRRYRSSGNSEALDRCRRCVQFLEAHKDVDGDGVVGWSLDRDWDAFADGSVNPKGTVYAITTAIVLDGLSEFYAAAPLADHAGITSLVKEASLDSAAALYKNGFFAYSSSPNDPYFVLNASSYFAGALQRAIVGPWNGFTTDQKTDLQSKIDSATALLNAETQPGQSLWPYHAHSSPFYGVSYDGNDLVHHTYVVLGLREVDHFGGPVDPSNSPQHEAAMLTFERTGYTAGYSSAFPGDARYPDIENRYSDLWGIGSGVVLACELGRFDLAKTWITRMTTQFGPWPRPNMWPTVVAPDQTYFFGRHAAHALWGMSRYLYR